jgi:hypothetical protein
MMVLGAWRCTMIPVEAFWTTAVASALLSELEGRDRDDDIAGACSLGSGEGTGWPTLGMPAAWTVVLATELLIIS